MDRSREQWIDCIKIFACILVVLGHFFQSMIAARLMLESSLYIWFNRTIYYFHVPLFFICSGYLYQRRSRTDAVSSWHDQLIKKGIVLGIPYFIFSAVTWILKEVFSGSVNIPNKGFLETLFLSPLSPYWYLYALFFIFAVTPTCSSKTNAAVGFMGALILKFASISMGGTGIYCITTVMENEIWFVLGMVLCVFDIPASCRSKKWLYTGVGLAVIFLGSSVAAAKYGFYSSTAELGMGLLGCIATVLLTLNLCAKSKKIKILEQLSAYTLPIFLMHTIFAAGLRAILFKCGVTNIFVHVFLGVTISFAGPVLAATIMKQMRLDVLLYPGQYIKRSR